MISASATSAQTSRPSTPKSRADIVSLCEKARDEVVASRRLIDEYTKLIDNYEATLKKSAEMDALSGEVIAAYKTEVASLRAAVDKQTAIIAIREAEIVTYEKALSKEKKKKNFYKTMWTLTGAALAGVVVVSMVN